MEYLPIIFIGAIFLCLLLLLGRKSKDAPQKPKPQIIPEYDSEGYNQQGYNEVGRNRQGKYNRYYNVKCYRTNLYSEEGFLDIQQIHTSDNSTVNKNRATIAGRPAFYLGYTSLIHS